MTDREAMKMALEALIASHPIANTDKSLDKHSEAMSALRQALAQPEQDEGVDGSVRIYIKRNGTFERVDTVEKALELSREMHTAPPKREWVGLTDEELVNMVGESVDKAGGWFRYHSFARAIEAKLKEKNNG